MHKHLQMNEFIFYISIYMYIYIYVYIIWTNIHARTHKYTCVYL